MRVGRQNPWQRWRTCYRYLPFCAGKPTAAIAQSREGMQLSFFQLDDPVLCQVRDEIIGLDINNLTPVEALNKLNEIKKIVTGK